MLRYLNYALNQTTAPAVYHLGVGLAVLAVTCPKEYHVEYFGGPLRPNSYCLLVGRSGEEQKSTALHVGRGLLKEACPKLLGPTPGSSEGLIDSLSVTGTQLIPFSEFGTFLTSAQRGYFASIKTYLAMLWDCEPVSRRLANQKMVEAKDPRLSVMAACSLPYLESYTLAEDWTGGFMGRWMVFYGKRKNVEALPKQADPAEHAWLVDRLKAKVTAGKAGRCEGMDSGAAAYWRMWFADITERNLPNNILGIRARAPTMAYKAALTLGWDFGPGSLGRPWRLTTAELEPAIAITELHVKSLISLSDSIAEHADARLWRRITIAIQDQGGSASLGDILRDLRMSKRKIVEMLDAMREAGILQVVTTPGGIVYKLMINGFHHY